MTKIEGMLGKVKGKYPPMKTKPIQERKKLIKVSEIHRAKDKEDILAHVNAGQDQENRTLEEDIQTKDVIAQLQVKTRGHLGEQRTTEQ